MYNCMADNPDELTFSEGEVIVVDGEEDQEWWVSIPMYVYLDVCVFQYQQHATMHIPIVSPPQKNPNVSFEACSANLA